MWRVVVDNPDRSGLWKTGFNTVGKHQTLSDSKCFKTTTTATSGPFAWTQCRRYRSTTDIFLFNGDDDGGVRGDGTPSDDAHGDDGVRDRGARDDGVVHDAPDHDDPVRDGVVHDDPVRDGAERKAAVEARGDEVHGDGVHDDDGEEAASPAHKCCPLSMSTEWFVSPPYCDTEQHTEKHTFIGKININECHRDNIFF